MPKFMRNMSSGFFSVKKVLRLSITLHLWQESIIIQLNTDQGGPYDFKKRLSEKITESVKGYIL